MIPHNPTTGHFHDNIGMHQSFDYGAPPFGTYPNEIEGMIEWFDVENLMTC